MKNLFRNKKFIIILSVVIILIGSFLCYLFFKDDRDVVNNLKVTYYGGDSVKLDKGDLPFEKRITVENTTDDAITYSLEWNHVKNTFSDQNKFLYTIDGKGEYAASLGKSQVPVAGYKVYNSVVIMGHKKHTYTIKFDYSGKDNKGLFEGTIYINSEKVKKSKMKDDDLLKKQEEKVRRQHEKDMKKNVDA